MQRFEERFGYFGEWKDKTPVRCICDLDGYCHACEIMSKSQICWFNDVVDKGKTNYTEWDAGQQDHFIQMLQEAHQLIIDRGAESIWATVVLRQAYDVAKWMVQKGYTSYEPRGYYCNDEYDQMCVPYDASTWRNWIKRELKYCEPGVIDTHISNEHIKSVTRNLVRRKYIKIPLNSGLPHYYWVLNRYKFEDFCRIYACIEYIYEGKFNFHELEVSMKHHMDLVMKAKTGFRLIYVMYICGTGEEFEFPYTVKVLKKIRLMYRDRKQSAAAIKIQRLFRAYRSKKVVDTMRALPDNLFHPDFTKARQNVLSIDATGFAPTL